MRRLLLPLVLVTTFLAAPALAQQEGGGEGATTTVAPADLPEPAVLVEAPPVEEQDPAWTYRYLVPTGLIIGVAVIFVTALLYFVRVVRTRYRVVR